MDNNELFKRMRYALQIDDAAAIKILNAGGLTATDAEVSAWRSALTDDDAVGCPNAAISAFLAGYIVERRGPQEGKPVTSPSTAYVSNNQVLKLIKIALAMRSEDLQAALRLGGATLSESEVSALLRKPGTRNYRQCGDQILRQFFTGVAKHQRDDSSGRDPHGIWPVQD